MSSAHANAMVEWAPLLTKAFLLNLLIGMLAMTIGTVLGVVLGSLQLVRTPIVSFAAKLTTQIMRNSPWLVSLFYVMYLVPFEVDIAGVAVSMPDWVKATLGLSIPAVGNMSEIVKGGIRSIPRTQWEAASALGYTTRQTLVVVVLPQALKSMLPPWMNLYSIITLSTVLANIVGVPELITTARQMLVSMADPSLLLPVYGAVMAMFFSCVYPISLVTRSLERRWSVKGTI